MGGQVVELQGKIPTLTLLIMDCIFGFSKGLIGDNGVGKSTLLRQLANYGIPGQPMHLRCLYVKQEIAIKPNDTRTTAQALVEDSGVDETREETRTRIRELTEAIDSFEFTESRNTRSENAEDSGSDSVNDEEVLTEMHERLSELEDELAGLADDRLLERAEAVLTGLWRHKVNPNTAAPCEVATEVKPWVSIRFTWL